MTGVRITIRRTSDDSRETFVAEEMPEGRGRVYRVGRPSYVRPTYAEAESIARQAVQALTAMGWEIVTE